jgi:archaellum component FlaC
MADEPDNILLQYMRRFDEKLDRVVDEMLDVKVRLTAVGEGLAGINRRLDRLEMRVERIERRLDLVDHPR